MISCEWCETSITFAHGIKWTRKNAVQLLAMVRLNRSQRRGIRNELKIFRWCTQPQPYFIQLLFVVVAVSIGLYICRKFTTYWSLHMKYAIKFNSLRHNKWQQTNGICIGLFFRWSVFSDMWILNGLMDLVKFIIVALVDDFIPTHAMQYRNKIEPNMSSANLWDY